MKKNGFVYLIGAGPGDPGLFTLKGKKALEKAEVVVYDRLLGDEILSFINDKAELIYVGKSSGNHIVKQEDINKLLLNKAREGKIVARLKGGDPFVFGRGGEEALCLFENGFEFEVIPGISSAIAVPAYAGIPVTHRDIASSFAVITGHEKPGKVESSICWEKLATGIDTLIFLMGIENLTYIVRNLRDNGRNPDTPVALIRWGTRPNQEILTGKLMDIVEKVKETKFSSPAVIIVGETVNLHEKLSWLEKKPLWKKKVLVTRSRAQASQLLKQIQELGGEAIEFPSIKIQKEEDMSELHYSFQHLEEYDWLIFTSVNAVDIFFAELKARNNDIRDLKGISICAIGPATCKRLENRGLLVDIVPNEYMAEGVIDELSKRIKPGHRILLPRARGARKLLPDTMREWGAEVDEIYLYEAVPDNDINEGKIQEIREGKYDFISFTSSSTVKNFVNIIGADYIPVIDANVKVACIGPITAATACEYGFNVDLTAKEYTIDGLVEAIVDTVHT